jgi:hypothetical protein
MHTTAELDMTLRAHTRGSPITIRTADHRSVTLREGRTRLTINTPTAPRLDLFQILDITPGLYQRITVESVVLNGIALDLHHPDGWLSLDDPLHRPGDTELAYNGRVTLDCTDRARWWYTEWHRSDRRWDWVYDNERANCESDRNCWSNCDPEHRPRWVDRPHDPVPDHIDTACFGCSITQGSALRRGEEWPALMPGHNANFAQAGAGVDAMWMNLHRAMEQHRFRRVILVVPSWHRRLERLTRQGETLRMPVTVTRRVDRDPEDARDRGLRPSLWWHHGDRHRMVRRGQRLLLTRDHRRRGLRIVDRIRHLLDRTGTPYWIASTDPETQSDLVTQSVIPRDRILPQFQNDRGAPDHLHASARAHQRWVDQILPLIQ